MSKRLLLIIVGAIVLLVGGVYFITARKLPTAGSAPQNSTATSSQLSELPNDWTTYTSPEWGFAINTPPDLKTELTQGGTHFLKLGPTQKTETELYDGLSLLIFTAQLPSTRAFESFVKNEYGKIKNDNIYSSVSALEKTQIATYQGYKFTATGIGTSTTYYLDDNKGGYVKITDMTVEPANTLRDFHKTVEQMLNTFQLTSTTTSADNAPAGSIHNLPVPKAVSATKEFASKDLNAPLGEVIVMSAYEKEWPNACLGLQQEGEMCAEMITAGYEITIEAGGKTRIYHTNTDGSIIKIRK